MADIAKNELCADKFPEWFQFFERRSCVNELEEKERIERARERREEAAFQCIADDLSRLEGEVTALRNALNQEMTFEQAIATAEKTVGERPSIVASENNIREQVGVLRFKPKCASDFSILVNINGEPEKLVRHFGVWAKNSPKSYIEGFRSDFSVNFATRRAEAVATRNARERLEELEAREAADIKRRAAAEAEARKRKAAADAEARKAAQDKQSYIAWLNRLPDPCAPRLNFTDRLKRLEKFGTVKQHSSMNYSVKLKYGMTQHLSGSEIIMIDCYGTR
ncbi:hypothetical protein OAI11_00850 [Rhodospirillales bacterium]|nr:hypothetical protein [Rhodospirillales bacterium]